MNIYGAYASPYTRKVLVCLEEKRIEHGFEQFAPFPKTAELLQKHPQGYIPILEHDGRFIPDSSVICEYLEKIYPEHPLYPDAPFEYADALFHEEYADTSVMGSIAPVFSERFIKKVVFGEAPDEERVRDGLENKIPPVFDYLEGKLSQDATSLLERFTVVDAAIGSYLTCLYLSGEKIDGERWPKLVQYHRALRVRPSFQKVEGELKTN